MRKVLIIFVLTCIVLAVFAAFINPIVTEYSKSKIHSMTVAAINRAIGDVMSIDQFAGFTVVEKDAVGKIVSVQTDTVKINGISGQIALASQGYIEEFMQEKLGVPIGTFSGIPIFTGRGFDVPLRVVPVGTVYCIFNTEFIGRGINQTVHRIVLTTKTTVNLIMPLGSKNILSEIDVLLCENVIIGEVPEFYLGVGDK